MRVADLITSKDDGSLSLTKLAAATAHFLFACSFLRMQVLGEASFDETLWLVYGAFAIGHAAYDKTSAIVRDIKEQQIQAKAEADSVPVGPQVVTNINNPPTP
jgi:hypothetical protein